MLQAICKPPSISLALAMLGALLLALDPLLWLVQGWTAAEGSGLGALVFAGLVVLMLVSFASGNPQSQAPRLQTRTLMCLMLTTASLRLASQWLDINVVGALLLGVDVYALARLARLDSRPLSLSPVWLGLLFCFCLPVEVIVQRLAGYPLQVVAAHMAYALLWPFVDNLSLHGVRLLINGVDVLVDLPCSGSTLLSVLGVIWVALQSVFRPGPVRALVNAVGFVVIVLFANSVRVALLAAGIGYEAHTGIDVMQPLPHNGIGVVTGTWAAMLLLHMMGVASEPALSPARTPAQSPTGSTRNKPLPVSITGAFCFFALTVGALQPQPVDASPALNLPVLPTVAAGFLADHEMLSPAEENYFATYGGAARRASYGPFGLLAVTTESPLRHLHDPAVCFRGMGFAVRLLGSDFAHGRTVYRVSDPHTRREYDLYVSYAGSSGTALSIAEVVWRWLDDTSRGVPSRWTMVQRIVPAELVGSEAARQFDATMRRAFEV